MLTEEFGVGFDQMIPLLFERGMRMLAAIYAVLMAGGAYVPLEPHYPSARILGILEQVTPSGVSPVFHRSRFFLVLGVWRPLLGPRDPPGADPG